MRRNVFTEGMNGPNDDEKCCIHVIWKNWEKKWHLANRQTMLICEAFGLQIATYDPEPYLRKLLSESLMHGWNMTEPARIPLRQRRCSSQCVFVVTKKHKSTKLLEAFKQRQPQCGCCNCGNLWRDGLFKRCTENSTKWFYFYFFVGFGKNVVQRWGTSWLSIN